MKVPVVVPAGVRLSALFSFKITFGFVSSLVEVLNIYVLSDVSFLDL